MAAGSMGASLLGALQAALSVLLTLSYGVMAAQMGLLKEKSANDISKLCVKLFLPALLITTVGQELHSDTVMVYVPIVVWAIVTALFSLALSWAAVRLFGLPTWVIPATAFNNTTALPLLLVQSVATTGILSTLYKSDLDTKDAVVQRAKSYFLASAVVGSALTFALGPRIMQSDNDRSDDGGSGEEDEEEDGSVRTVYAENGTREQSYAERGEARRSGGEATARDQHEEHGATEETSLLPDAVVKRQKDVVDASNRKGGKIWSRLPPSVQHGLSFLYEFVNSPVIGGVLAILVGFVPFLHRAAFAEPSEGGIFTAWLTRSISDIGDLFPALQVVVVGVKLCTSLRKMKRGEDSGHVPYGAMIFVLTVRFVLWPVMSIGTIYFLTSRTSWFSDDPILWFALMLMPTGPTAMKVTAMADVSGAPNSEQMSIAKFLTISYMVSPLIAFAVVGSIKASEALLSK